MLKDVAILNVAPELSKAAIQSASESIMSKVEAGELKPLDVWMKITTLSKLSEDLKEKLRGLVRSEAETIGKTFDYQGAKIELSESGVTYDYTNCNDPEWTDLKAKLKEREAFLKNVHGIMTLVDRGSGESYDINPPIKKSTSTIKVTYK